jgi:hypothetical protein
MTPGGGSPHDSPVSVMVAVLPGVVVGCGQPLSDRTRWCLCAFIIMLVSLKLTLRGGHLAYVSTFYSWGLHRTGD